MRRLLLALLALAVSIPGCDRKGSGRAKSYKLVGVVRAVDPAGGVVTIRHEEIRGFMKPMTMPFSVRKTDANREVLDGLRPGDKVEATLRVTGEDSELSDLEITDYAAPEPIVFAEPSRLSIGAAVPDFAMTTQEGKALKLSDLRGEVVVLTFIYTRCPLPNFCPLMDRKFGEMAAQLAAVPSRAARVRLLSVSFDPEHDTPEALATHAKLRGAKPPLWTFAVASHEELQKVAAPLGMTYGPGSEGIMHNLSTVVIAPDGTLARREAGGAWTPAEILKAVAALLRADKG